MSAPATLPAPATALPAKRFLRIIYADDVAELRDVARISFSRQGHGIECFADGWLALQRIAVDSGFDLVITDHQMPVMDGLELVRRLRAQGFPGKIMVFSSDLSSEAAEEYKRLAVDRVLYKPIFPSQLRQVVAELFPGTTQK